jgi:biopolymer transport protein ExbD
VGGVSVDSGGKGGRKSVDSNINMVPMIDLLISVIAFLLMTAVWVQTGQLSAAQPRGAPSPDSAPPPVEDQLKIMVNPSGLRVGTSATDMVDIQNGPHRIEELRTNLSRRHTANAQQREVWVQPDSAVTYSDIIEVMDVIYEVWGSGHAPTQRVSDMVTIRFL